MYMDDIFFNYICKILLILHPFNNVFNISRSCYESDNENIDHVLVTEAGIHALVIDFVIDMNSKRG